MSRAKSPGMRYLLLLFLLLTLGAVAETPSEKANRLFEEAYQEGLSHSPMQMSRLGMKVDYDRWDDYSDAAAQAELERTKKWLARIQAEVDPGQLDPETRLSYQLFVQQAERDIKNFPFRFHNYPVNQMFGIQAEIPAFMVNVHQLEKEDDARAYISRLHGMSALLQQIVEQLRQREEMGIVPPRLVHDYVLGDIKNMLRGKPFEEDAEDHLLLADFRLKLSQLEIPAERKTLLERQAELALAEAVGPAFRRLHDFVEAQRGRADDRAGVWKWPQGAEFYSLALQNTTTTDMTSDEIHELGLREVARLQGEMKVIMRKVGFEGSLQEFFAFMRQDQQFYYADDESGKAAYLKDATALIDAMKGRLDELFLTKPKAGMIVKRVEAFREESAGKAFYERPPLDGSRPGIYYVNLLSTENQPRYEMEALAYHEGLPGHHMQLTIAQELEGIPKFRSLGSFTAYIEGWGLYCELLPKEIGCYQDPYSDFGRLAMELWRACRLVVDTGIHSRRWTREKAIDYYRTNTPGSERNCVSMVDRHIVMPSQATAYKIGMNKILELRAKARQALGERFDIREFHDVVLTHGAVPLNVLEQLVDDYIASK